jgi:hypothetical protein
MLLSYNIYKLKLNYYSLTLLPRNYGLYTAHIPHTPKISVKSLTSEGIC